MINPVYFYIPNLIGYFRLFCILVSGTFSLKKYENALFWYLLSYGLDAIDGTVARYFNQCSIYGTLMDLITDRSSTLGLSFILTNLYPKAVKSFAIFSSLDVFSHWLQFASALEADATTHKQSNFWVLNFYYCFPHALLATCIGQEMFLVLLYLKKNLKAKFRYDLCVLMINLFLPLFYFKQVCNVYQIKESIKFFV